MKISFSFVFSVAAVFILLLCQASTTVAKRAPACGDNCKAAFFADQDFTPVTEFTDEFRCRRRRCRNVGRKWIVNDPKRGTGGTTWAGRQPLLFSIKNVFKERGHLTVEARGWPKNYTRGWNATFNVAPPNGGGKTFVEAGYNYFTGGFVQARTAVKYGFFESRFKPTKLKLVSAFWMSLNTPTKWTEIDVAECAHVSGEEQKFGVDWRRRVRGNAHSFRDPDKGTSLSNIHTANPPSYVHSQDLADSFNDFAVFWSDSKIEWFFNGRPIAAINNDYWDQELHPKWTVEANFQWQGVLPDPQELKRLRRRERYKRIVHGSNELSIAHIRTWSTTPKVATTTTRQFGKFKGTTNVKELNKIVEKTKPKLNPNAKEKKERFDVLQRAPEPGEKLLEPVTPPKGETWAEEVQKAINRRRRRRR